MSSSSRATGPTFHEAPIDNAMFDFSGDQSLKLEV